MKTMLINSLMSIHRILPSAVLIAVVFLPAILQAQANRGSTTSGAFGQTSLGGTSGASPSGLGTGMTQGMSSGSAQSGSGTGGVSTGGSTFGQASGTNMQNLQAGGQTGFIGQSSANNAQNFFATGQRGSTSQNFNALTQLMSKSRQNQFNQQQAQKASRTGAQAQSQFRVPLRVGFQAPPPQPRRFNTIVSGRLAKVPGMSQLGKIEATLEGDRTVVLRGTVATEADRQLAEGLARLEPEALAVRNELVVGSAQGTTGEALPPPPAAANQ